VLGIGAVAIAGAVVIAAVAAAAGTTTLGVVVVPPAGTTLLGVAVEPPATTTGLPVTAAPPVAFGIGAGTAVAGAAVGVVMIVPLIAGVALITVLALRPRRRPNSPRRVDEVTGE